MKDDSYSVAHARPHSAHAVAKVDAVIALRPLHGAIMHGEDHGIALRKRHDFGATLPARPLFGQDELASAEIPARLRQQDRDLDREGELAVEILVQAIEVAGNVLQQERCGTGLAGFVASLQEGGMVLGNSAH